MEHLSRLIDDSRKLVTMAYELSAKNKPLKMTLRIMALGIDRNGFLASLPSEAALSKATKPKTAWFTDTGGARLTAAPESGWRSHYL